MSSDEAKALAFLMGRDHEILPDDHQRALVRVLRDSAPLDRTIRDALARALEPFGITPFKLSRKKRDAGAPDQLHRRLPQALAIQKEMVARLIEEGDGHGHRKGVQEMIAAELKMTPRTLRDRQKTINWQPPKRVLKKRVRKPRQAVE